MFVRPRPFCSVPKEPEDGQGEDDQEKPAAGDGAQEEHLPVDAALHRGDKGVLQHQDGHQRVHEPQQVKLAQKDGGRGPLELDSGGGDFIGV